MKLDMRKAPASGQLPLRSWDLAVCGKPLDDRGSAVVNAVSSSATRVLRLSYDPDSHTVDLDGMSVGVDTVPTALATHLTGSVLIEATTLGFVDVLLCCRAFRQLSVSDFDVLYVEPLRYRIPRRRHLLHRRDFELSSDVPGYRAVPGNAVLLGDRRPQRAVFFLGYEEARLLRAFEDLQMIRPSRTALVFGVPAFNPGWEMDALANNISVIRDQNIRGGIHFCGAENPVAAHEVLSQIRSSLSSSERMFVGPIGTKPHGIGVALFVSQHPDVGIVYDHPKRMPRRSNSTGNWHYFSISDFLAAS